MQVLSCTQMVQKPPGFCWSGGKVILDDIGDSSEPLKSLLNLSHQDSKICLILFLYIFGF